MPDSQQRSPLPRWRRWARPGQTRPGRIKPGLAALSAAAITAVYAAGYFQTDADYASSASASADSALPAPIASDDDSAPTLARSDDAGATADPTATTTTTGATGRTGGAAARSGATATATATPGGGAAAGATSGYADGTYTGTGNSKHGSITATVVVSGGRVVSAEITGCNTRYPCSKVASLPAKVVAAQKSTADYVSGSTDSSRAYMGAISSALAKAVSA